MTLSEFRRIYRSLNDEKKEEFILALYKRAGKLEKEMYSLILEAVNEDKELPPAKSEIPDVSALKKKFEKMDSAVYGWKVRRPKSLSKFKKSAREIYKQLLLCPVQAECYDETVDLLVDLFRLICGGEEQGLLYGPVFDTGPFSCINFYRSVCSMVLAKGFKQDALESLIRLPAEECYNDYRRSYKCYEILVTFLKTGDARLEVSDLTKAILEKWIASYRNGEGPLDRIIPYWIVSGSILYFMLAAMDVGEEFAEEELADILSPDWMSRFKEGYEKATIYPGGFYEYAD